MSQPDIESILTRVIETEVAKAIQDVVHQNLPQPKSSSVTTDEVAVRLAGVESNLVGLNQLLIEMLSALRDDDNT